MLTRVSIFVSTVLLLSISFIARAQAQESDSVNAAHAQALLALHDVGQQDNSDNNQQSDNGAIEGTVVTASRDTIVVRTADDKFYLFTYDHPSVRTKGAVPGARVRVTAGNPDENGARVATNVEVVSGPTAGGGATKAAAPPAQVPAKVHNIENEIRREGRRWDLGVRAGAAFDPETFPVRRPVTDGPDPQPARFLPAER